MQQFVGIPLLDSQVYGSIFYFDIISVINYFQALDYTLIGCDHARIENELGIFPLEFVDARGRVTDDIFIFQHPKGESKMVSYHKISDIQPPFLFYKADTDVGSSGSPVLRQFKLIAIHSKGNEPLRYNKGILCTAILQDLNEKCK